MFVSRRNCGICLLALALALALVGAGWSQTATPPASDPAKDYGQAVSLLEEAQQQLEAKNLPGALSLVKQSNELFTLLQKESATKLAERQLSSQERPAVGHQPKTGVRHPGPGGSSAGDRRRQEEASRGTESPGTGRGG